LLSAIFKTARLGACVRARMGRQERQEHSAKMRKTDGKQHVINTKNNCIRQNHALTTKSLKTGERRMYTE
jgi:hypothetical protein